MKTPFAAIGIAGFIEESLTADGLWFNTGDLARVDEDGFVYLEGRQKEMIIVAGENVFALEVEKCILDLEGIKEVAVLGIPERVCALRWAN